VGMGIPRETIRLVQRAGTLALFGTRSATDHTANMETYTRRRVRELRAADLSGYIFKKGSPSCGLYRVKVYREGSDAAPRANGRGLFAAGLTAAMPGLPVEEEGRLHDPHLRDSFFERVFAYRRVRSLFSGRWSVGDLVAFHSREKMLMLAHDRPAYTALGRLVAAAKQTPRREVAESYAALFLAGLEKAATTRKHVNVLQHMAGHFKKTLNAPARAELHEVIEDFRRGLVPLVVPITLLRHHVRMHEIDYLAGQTYLEPHPKELMLRNHV